MTAYHIRPAQQDDSAAIAEVYNHYVHHTLATLQETPAQAADFSTMIDKAHVPFLVAADDGSGELLGYCYADTMKSRCGYRHTYESSVYVAAAAAGGGIGKALMAALIAAAKQSPAHTLVAVIGMPNPASVVLHEQFGFIHCGTLPAVGWKFNKWQDVGYWVLRLKEGAPD